MRMTHIQAVLLRTRLAGVGMEVVCWRVLLAAKSLNETF